LRKSQVKTRTELSGMPIATAFRRMSSSSNGGQGKQRLWKCFGRGKQRGRDHSFKTLRTDGPARGIHTLAALARQIARGHSVPGRDGTTLHWVCNGDAYITYNGVTKTLITFSQGKER